MSGRVIPFRRPTSLDGLDADQLAAALGSPAEWAASAVDYLHQQVCSRNDGAVDVSVAALHIALRHISDLEGRLGRAPTGGAS